MASSWVSTFDSWLTYESVLTFELVLTFDPLLTLAAAVWVQARRRGLRGSLEHPWRRSVPCHLRFDSRGRVAFGQRLSHPPPLLGANEGSGHLHDGAIASRRRWKDRLKNGCDLWFCDPLKPMFNIGWWFSWFARLNVMCWTSILSDSIEGYVK